MWEAWIDRDIQKSGTHDYTGPLRSHGMLSSISAYRGQPKDYNYKVYDTA